jgi:hypothetical protein
VQHHLFKVKVSATGRIAVKNVTEGRKWHFHNKLEESRNHSHDGRQICDAIRADLDGIGYGHLQWDVDFVGYECIDEYTISYFLAKVEDDD